jgi:hypothetical protein
VEGEPGKEGLTDATSKAIPGGVCAVNAVTRQVARRNFIIP